MLKPIQTHQLYGTDVEPNPSGGRVYSPDGICVTLGAGHGMSQPYVDDERIRKLTELECWRLMDFDDEDLLKAKSSGVSATQLYKQAGNSIVVAVLVAIFGNMINDVTPKVG